MTWKLIGRSLSGEIVDIKKGFLSKEDAYKKKELLEKSTSIWVWLKVKEE